jgi:hypothetical protein
MVGKMGGFGLFGINPVFAKTKKIVAITGHFLKFQAQASH